MNSAILGCELMKPVSAVGRSMCSPASIGCIPCGGPVADAWTAAIQKPPPAWPWGDPPRALAAAAAAAAARSSSSPPIARDACLPRMLTASLRRRTAYLAPPKHSIYHKLNLNSVLHGDIVQESTICTPRPLFSVQAVFSRAYYGVPLLRWRSRSLRRCASTFAMGPWELWNGILEYYGHGLPGAQRRTSQSHCRVIAIFNSS